MTTPGAGTAVSGPRDGDGDGGGGRDSAGLRRLYDDFADGHLVPLWTEREDLMPAQPTPATQLHVWRWSALYPLAQRAGDLVPVARGGERRAIALANPGLGGQPYATPTLWAAIQYLGPREAAPEHRHTQNAFRFVVEGEGVWTVVDGDPVAMRRGDFLLTPGWAGTGTISCPRPSGNTSRRVPRTPSGYSAPPGCGAISGTSTASRL